VLEDFLGYQNSQVFLLSMIQDHNLLGEFSMHLRQACLDFWEFCTAQHGLLAEFSHRPKTNFVIITKNYDFNLFTLMLFKLSTARFVDL
jgi:hypothetical protein